MSKSPEFWTGGSSEQGKPNLQPTQPLSLREFAQRVSLICNLETGGKLGPQEAYKKVKVLYKQLKKSRPEAV
jgi:glutathione peroxidase-family protein